MNVSFIIPYFSDRLDNINQTLRFLSRREPDLEHSQLVLVCGDDYAPLQSPFHDTVFVSMGLKHYRKNIMLNEGVRRSSNDILVLLDSDRILPINYFTRLATSHREGEVTTTRRLYSLPKPYSDEQIESLEVDRIADFRSTQNKMRKKNLFSGNTVILKKDLELIGGFDESFVGYGFSDTDMTIASQRVGLRHVFLEEEELHLHHPIGVLWGGSTADPAVVKATSAINGMRYCLKWGIRPDRSLLNLVSEIEPMLSTLHADISSQYRGMVEEMYYLSSIKTS